MKKILIAALLFSQASYSMIAPWYLRARQIDLAVTEMATHYLNYAGKVELAPISSIAYVTGGISVGMGNALCLLEIKTKSLPPGAVGVPGYSAVLDNNKCSALKTELKTVSYSKVKKAIDAAAAKSKQTVSVAVSKSGAVKLSEK